MALDTYKIVLTRQELQTVLTALGRQPYADVAPLIHNLLGQAQTSEKMAEGPDESALSVPGASAG